MKKLNFKEIIWYWGPVLFWAMIIFNFSANKTGIISPVQWQDFSAKKFAHIIEYMILTGLLYRGFFNSGFDKKKAGVSSIIIAICYAFTDEFHQSFTPGREPHIRDVIFDTIGATIALTIIWKLLPIVPKKLKRLAQELEIL